MKRSASAVRRKRLFRGVGNAAVLREIVGSEKKQPALYVLSIPRAAVEFVPESRGDVVSRSAQHPAIARRGTGIAVARLRKCFAESFVDDQAMDQAEIESGLSCCCSKEHPMPSTHELRIMDAHRSSPGSTEGHPKPAPAVRIGARPLAALHESREQEAAGVIRRHCDLIQNFQAIELSGLRGGAITHG